ncbi:uracil phosphoribosyltransferase [Flavobacterium sp.]|uniref:DUF6341 family protein n=1 Tax=Flavobacterium sp. TaxID=239 RepID=UPI00261EA13D|nr:uracil phosphoribosyltransferase [Flavobacterium sp.]
MKSFFEGIQWLFEQIIFAIHDILRAVELKPVWGWWAASIFNWAFWIVVCYYIYYWIIQLKEHKDNNEEYQDTTAHSFLK